jgi:hypothetical protein
MVEVCLDVRGDGCLEWVALEECRPRACARGACAVQCVSECGADGARRCEGVTGYRTCEPAGADGCRAWSDRVPCPPGQVCSNGRCAPACEHECSREGVRQCGSPHGIQACTRAPGGCLAWGTEVTCPAGQVCSNGACARTCQAECTVMGATRCNGETWQTCADANGDACLEWGSSVPCPDGQACDQGRCTATCVGECDERGSQSCNGLGNLVTCEARQRDGCLRWGTPVPCPAGRSCSQGACRRACQNECLPAGAPTCEGNAVRSCGESDGDPCPDLGTPVWCNAGQWCADGRCSAQCRAECSAQGARRCVDSLDWAVCQPWPDNPCLHWSTPHACPAGTVCSNGQCLTTCVAECTVSGARRCTSSRGGFRTCGNWDGDTCLEWGWAEACPTGMKCSAGECARACRDECDQVAALRCDGSARFQTCGDVDGDGCLEWGTPQSCEEGHQCQGGRCTPGCHPDCAREGQRTCDDARTAVLECGDYDRDGSLEWGTPRECPARMRCFGGKCSAVCSDECHAAGEKRCSGPASWRECRDRDGDGCLEWGSSLGCPLGGLCAEGECVEGPLRPDAFDVRAGCLPAPRPAQRK